MARRLAPPPGGEEPEGLRGTIDQQRQEARRKAEERRQARTAARTESALEALVSKTWVDKERNMLTVRALNAVGVLPTMLSALESIGLQAAEVRVRENTLEDVFIQLTGRRLRQ